jgi:mannitol-1-phosphate 5-dehydrogenase
MVEEAGFEVIIIARNRQRFEELTKNPVIQITKANHDTSKTQEIRLSSVIDETDFNALTRLICDPDLKLIFTAVGLGEKHLTRVAQVLARALMNRRETGIDNPICILPFENVAESGKVFQEMLEDFAKGPIANVFTSSVVVDCMSFRPKNGHVIREPYEETIIALSGNPEIDKVILNLRPVSTINEGIADYYQRKIGLVSAIHTAIGWLGSYAEIELVNQAIRDPRIFRLIEPLIEEMAEAVYHLTGQKFDRKELKAYGQRTVQRIKNPYLPDPCIKFTRRLPIKLSSNERFAKPAIHFFSALGEIPLTLCKIMGIGLWLGLNIVEGIGAQCLQAINCLPPQLKEIILKFAENPVL